MSDNRNDYEQACKLVAQMHHAATGFDGPQIGVLEDVAAVAAERDRYRAALELIAAPMRPDGTWNREREACRQIASDAIGGMVFRKCADCDLLNGCREYCRCASDRIRGWPAASEARRCNSANSACVSAHDAIHSLHRNTQPGTSK